MAKKKRKEKKERVLAKYLKLAGHDVHCGCRSKGCVRLRRIRRRIAKEMKPHHEAVEESTHITAKDLAVTINY